MIRVMTIVGTRPELIRLSRTISLLDISTEHSLVHTGQNFDYELNEIFFDQLCIRKPDYFLAAAGKSAMDTVANVISKVDRLLDEVRPDALLILGDTNTALSAIPAKRKKIPIFHMEAGNRCFDVNVPEEINRKIVDHIADINLTYSQIARQYLIREGLPPDQIIVTGSPMKEVCDFYKDHIESSNILQTHGVKPRQYFVLSLHREENVDSVQRLNKLVDTLTGVQERYGYPIIFSAHPRTVKNILDSKLDLPDLVKICKPFGFFDYLQLQKNAYCVFSDSGTITEEASILGFNALNFRDVNERPEGYEEGSVMMVGLDKERVLNGLKLLENLVAIGGEGHRIVGDYDPTPVSTKVVKIILSYTHFVNQRTWGVSL